MKIPQRPRKGDDFPKSPKPLPNIGKGFLLFIYFLMKIFFLEIVQNVALVALGSWAAD